MKVKISNGRNVDAESSLPEPDGPITHTTSPYETGGVTSLRTRFAATHLLSASARMTSVATI